MKSTAFIFPGQGAQYPGMGKDFASSYQVARHTFEEANDILQRDLRKIIFEGPADLLKETVNSQPAIYVTSVALLRVLEELFPSCRALYCAGLSLGEYSALTASKILRFREALSLVQHRANCMHDACLAFPGTMAVVLGLSAGEVEAAIEDLALPGDLWAANFNCPGQVVISGTMHGISEGTKAMLERGARRVVPLQVAGAFHSGLMRPAKVAFSPYVSATDFQPSSISLVANVTGQVPAGVEELKTNLTEQVTSPVRWEQSLRELEAREVSLYVEIGPGKTLMGFVKRTGVRGMTASLEKTSDLSQLESILEKAGA